MVANIFHIIFRSYRTLQLASENVGRVRWCLFTVFFCFLCHSHFIGLYERLYALSVDWMLFHFGRNNFGAKFSYEHFLIGALVIIITCGGHSKLAKLFVSFYFLLHFRNVYAKNTLLHLVCWINKNYIEVGECQKMKKKKMPKRKMGRRTRILEL